MVSHLTSMCEIGDAALRCLHLEPPIHIATLLPKGLLATGLLPEICHFPRYIPESLKEVSAMLKLSTFHLGTL